jgi:alpha-1,6-mannosyltransferase
MTAKSASIEIITARLPPVSLVARTENAWPLFTLWASGGLVTIAFACGLAFASHEFGYDRDVAAMPVLAFVAFFVMSGLVFAYTVPRLIQRASTLAAAETSRLLVMMIAAGLIARLILFASAPILEDDFQRYLWDGAVAAHGHNPYAASPRAVIEAGGAHPLAGLATASGHVVRRINHPLLTTIYPPITEAAFAVAYKLSPWSLTAWRFVLLVCDAASLAILIALLKTTGRSPLWAALYWWNPLVLKEGFNSAHMEPLVVVLVLLTLSLASRRRPVLAAAALAFAAGAKLWPALLLPVLIRASTNTQRQVLAATGVFCGLIALLAWPVLSAGISETSGFVAYAEGWKTNSALFPLLHAAAAPLLGMAGVTAAQSALAVKAGLALILGGLALTLCRRPIDTPLDLMRRSALLIFALVLLSPAQYPWYVMWVLPFAAFWPSRALLLMSGLIPLYYASFYFIARETIETAGPIIVAAIWLPVWMAVGFEVWQARAGSSLKGAAA